MLRVYLKANPKFLEKQLLFHKMNIDKVKPFVIFFVQRKNQRGFFAMNKRDLYRLHHRNLGLFNFLGSEAGHVLGATLVVHRGCTSAILGNMNQKLTKWFRAPKASSMKFASCLSVFWDIR